MDDYDSVTGPLRNGDALPSHPSNTTARKIVAYGPVYGVGDDIQLTAGLHRNEVATLQSGQRILEHAYRYAIIDRYIFHTRRSVVIRVRTEAIPDDVVE